MLSSPKSCTNILVPSDSGELQMSVYSGELTAENLITQSLKVLTAFPSLPNSFIDILLERVKAKGFSDQRLNDSINYVIDNCQYPTPTLANFLSFDKRVKVYTYNDLCGLASSGQASFEDFHRFKIDGKAHYVKIADKKLYNIPDEL